MLLNRFVRKYFRTQLNDEIGGCMERKINEDKTKEILQNARMIDDILFRLMGERNDVCQEILRTLLDDDELKVIKVKAQSREVSLFREVELDTLCILSDGQYCNIEVQKDDRKNDIKRVRFHASLITANKTPKGEIFSNIPNVKVIYISTYDILGNGQAVTHITRCQNVENNYLPIDDGEDIILANTEINDGTKHSRLLKLFLKSESFYDEMFPAISEAIHYYKETEGGQREVSEISKQIKKIWYDEGMEQGLEKGREVTIISLFDKGMISETDAAEELGLDVDSFRKIYEESNNHIGI